MSNAEPRPPCLRLLRCVLVEVNGPCFRQGMPPWFPLATKVHILNVSPPPALFRPLVQALDYDMQKRKQ